MSNRRQITVGFRTDPYEHQLVMNVAKQMDRTPSDALRVLVRRAALELGVAPSGQKSDASGKRAA
jgi:antitoxin component of RelBE/YafQ-DinJ toxin-antitoxin module